MEGTAVAKASWAPALPEQDPLPRDSGCPSSWPSPRQCEGYHARDVPVPSRFGSEVLSSSLPRRISLMGTNLLHLRLRRIPPPRWRKAVHPSEGRGETRGRAVPNLPCYLGDAPPGQQQGPRLAHSSCGYISRPRASGRPLEQELELGDPHAGGRRRFLWACALPSLRIRELDGGKDAGSRAAFLWKSCCRGPDKRAEKDLRRPLVDK